MNKNVLEVTIGHVTIRATGLAAVVVLAGCGLVIVGVGAWLGNAPWLR
ncbi:hypothetical protein [Agrobacterium cavarae]